MGKARHTSILFAEPTTWHNTGSVWEYGDYRMCYLVVRLTEEGYVPSVGSRVEVEYPGHRLPKSGRFTYATLEEAQNHLFRYVDYIRDVVDPASKEQLYHRMNDNTGFQIQRKRDH